ncbi:hypothetical protein CEXT_307271 [Caerostris extrusa]|uniref:Uncharacterized protein n=1 Tax=Caerostris extrusa TaxID=172846 RepID=A0AAV4WZG9_CAEEX|nr:hypothetical protein CEXT_307271 [Caerostris extrusa]
MYYLYANFSNEGRGLGGKGLSLELDLTLDQERWRPPRMSDGEEWSVLRRSTTPFGQVHQERVIRTYGYNECVNTLGAAGLAYISRKAI